MSARVELLQAAEDRAAAMPRFVPSVLVELYRNRGFRPIWDDTRAAQVVAVIRDASTQGLEPNDYGLATLQSFGRPSALARVARVDADLQLTDALLRYVHDLRFGKVDPRSLDPEWSYVRTPAPIERLDVLEQLLAAPDLAAAMKSAVARGVPYENLRTWLARYRVLADAGGWRAVSSGPMLRAGDRGPRVGELRERLREEGFWAPSDDVTLFDGDLDAAVHAFQDRYALVADGVVGPATLRAMNVGVDRRIDQLRLNLERLRWVTRNRDAPFVGVNIAGFRVYYVEDSKIVWSARAVVGKPFRQTPIFRATMTYLVLNPDWTVPPTILREDTLPAIRKNPHYLEAQHMDVLDANGKPVDPASIDWRKVRWRTFPYEIRQRPGAWNVLGKIKFVFPNEHMVFLHDTPSQQLFEQQQRIFSSGCIRIERPFELAALLLKDDPAWAPPALEQAVETGATKIVPLRTRVSVLIAYLTAVSFDADQELTFFDDVYARDDPLLAALDVPARTIAIEQ